MYGYISYNRLGSIKNSSWHTIQGVSSKFKQIVKSMKIENQPTKFPKT